MIKNILTLILVFLLSLNASVYGLAPGTLFRAHSSGPFVHMTPEEEQEWARAVFHDAEEDLQRQTKEEAAEEEDVFYDAKTGDLFEALNDGDREQLLNAFDRFMEETGRLAYGEYLPKWERRFYRLYRGLMGASMVTAFFFVGLPVSWPFMVQAAFHRWVQKQSDDYKKSMEGEGDPEKKKDLETRQMRWKRLSHVLEIMSPWRIAVHLATKVLSRSYVLARGEELNTRDQNRLFALMNVAMDQFHFETFKKTYDALNDYFAANMAEEFRVDIQKWLEDGEKLHRKWALYGQEHAGTTALQPASTHKQMLQDVAEWEKNLKDIASRYHIPDIEGYVNGVGISDFVNANKQSPLSWSSWFSGQWQQMKDKVVFWNEWLQKQWQRVSDRNLKEEPEKPLNGTDQEKEESFFSGFPKIEAEKFFKYSSYLLLGPGAFLLHLPGAEAETFPDTVFPIPNHDISPAELEKELTSTVGIPKNSFSPSIMETFKTSEIIFVSDEGEYFIADDIRKLSLQKFNEALEKDPYNPDMIKALMVILDGKSYALERMHSWADVHEKRGRKKHPSKKEIAAEYYEVRRLKVKFYENLQNIPKFSLDHVAMTMKAVPLPLHLFKREFLESLAESRILEKKDAHFFYRSFSNFKLPHQLGEEEKGAYIRLVQWLLAETFGVLSVLFPKMLLNPSAQEAEDYKNNLAKAASLEKLMKDLSGSHRPSFKELQMDLGEWDKQFSGPGISAPKAQIATEQLRLEQELMLYRKVLSFRDFASFVDSIYFQLERLDTFARYRMAVKAKESAFPLESAKPSGPKIVMPEYKIDFGAGATVVEKADFSEEIIGILQKNGILTDTKEEENFALTEKFSLQDWEKPIKENPYNPALINALLVLLDEKKCVLTGSLAKKDVEKISNLKEEIYKQITNFPVYHENEEDLSFIESFPTYVGRISLPDNISQKKIISDLLEKGVLEKNGRHIFYKDFSRMPKPNEISPSDQESILEFLEWFQAQTDAVLNVLAYRLNPLEESQLTKDLSRRYQKHLCIASCVEKFIIALLGISTNNVELSEAELSSLDSNGAESSLDRAMEDFSSILVGISPSFQRWLIDKQFLVKREGGRYEVHALIVTPKGQELWKSYAEEDSSAIYLSLLNYFKAKTECTLKGLKKDLENLQKKFDFPSFAAIMRLRRDMVRKYDEYLKAVELQRQTSAPENPVAVDLREEDLSWNALKAEKRWRQEGAFSGEGWAHNIVPEFSAQWEPLFKEEQSSKTASLWPVNLLTSERKEQFPIRTDFFSNEDVAFMMKHLSLEEIAILGSCKKRLCFERSSDPMTYGVMQMPDKDVVRVVFSTNFYNFLKEHPQSELLFQTILREEVFEAIHKNPNADYALFPKKDTKANVLRRELEIQSLLYAVDGLSAQEISDVATAVSEWCETCRMNRGCGIIKNMNSIYNALVSAAEKERDRRLALGMSLETVSAVASAKLKELSERLRTEMDLAYAA